MDAPSPEHDWVLAAPFRAHLHHLRSATGLPLAALAAAAGVPPALADHLVHGRRGRPLRRLAPGVASRLLALDADALDRQRLDRVPLARTGGQVLDLLAAGVPAADLAFWCRLSVTELRALPAQQWCSRLTRTLVQAAWQTHPVGAAAWPDDLDDPCDPRAA